MGFKCTYKYLNVKKLTEMYDQRQLQNLFSLVDDSGDSEDPDFL